MSEMSYQKIPKWVEQVIFFDLDYRNESGQLIWNKAAKHSSRKVGEEAGAVCENGIRVITFSKKGASFAVKAHRIVWFLETGYWPTNFIIHINGDKADNRFCNLELKTDDIELKTCSKCYEKKPIEQFVKLTRQCKTCRDKTHKDYRIRNATAIAKKRQSYWEEKGRDAKRVWAKNNRDKVRGYSQRRRSKPNEKILNTCRGRVCKLLKTQNARKHFKTIELIGCSVDFLKDYLESQFKDGMSWDNYGNPNGDHTNCWHIDHIIPCSSFVLTDPEQQKKCFHYTNLQPLWAKDNIRKHAKLDWKVA